MATPHIDHDRPRQERVKCVVVGDSGVGKTRLICARARNAKFCLKELCGTHVPTVWAIDQYHQHQEVLENSWEIVDGVNVTLRLWDTFGCHDKDRKYAYGRSDVVALCFSVTNPASLRHVVERWWPEIRRFCPKTPIILIGCRNDMRQLYKDPAYIKVMPDERRRVKESDIILPEKGRAMAAQIGAVAYYETSVLSGFGIRSVFTNAVRAALMHRRQTRFWAYHLKSVRNAEFQSPYLVPPPPTPEHRSVRSTFADDLAGMAVEPPFPDVELVCSDGVIRTHRILLAAASDKFHDILSPSHPDCDSIFSSVHVFRSFDRMEVIETEWGRQTRLTLQRCFRQRTVQTLVQFLYTGALDLTPETVQPLQVLSQDLEIKFLTKLIAVRLNGEEETKDTKDIRGESEQPEVLDEESAATKKEEGSVKLIQQFLCERDKRLASLALDSATPYSDVVFEVSDGQVLSFRGLVTKRSAYMSAMLCGNFDETLKLTVVIPDIEVDILRLCLYYLYIDQCPATKDVYEAMEVLVAADRFCMPRLIDLIQDHIITTYLSLSVGNDDCVVATKALELLEVAETFHAGYLYSWCCNFITTHYAFIYRHLLQQLRALTPLHQAMLSKQRWPPSWYISEYDLYEQSLERRRHDTLQMLRKKRGRFHLCSRAGTEAALAPLGPLAPLPVDRSRARSVPTRRDVVVARWRMLLCSR